MQIKLAETAGFCFGVDRAVSMAYELAEKGCKAVTLGQLIHNPTVTEDLEAKGMRVIESPEEASQGETVIIRAHGVRKSVYAELEAIGAEICDATCPFVKKIHNIVEENSAENIPVIIGGDPDHPEVIGICGYCKGGYHIFSTAEEAESFFKNNSGICQNGIIAVSQTTFSQNEWKKIK